MPYARTRAEHAYAYAHVAYTRMYTCRVYTHTHTHNMIKQTRRAHTREGDGFA
jgi:hypothetical protein